MFGLVFQAGTVLGLSCLRRNAKGGMRTMTKKGSVLMSFRKAATGIVAAMSMMALPSMAVAQTASASKLSVASAARSGATAEGEKLAGGSLIIAVLAAAAVVAGIIVAADSSDNPTSP
jgi:hypothetical protein